MAPPAVLNFVVHNLTAVRRFYDVIKVYRSTTGRNGAYAEVTTAADRIPLADNKVVYSYTHQTGADTDWYRITYCSTATGAESTATGTQRADLEQVDSIISADEIKTNYLFGLDLTDDDGSELPDSLYEWYARSAVDLLESQLDIAIRTQVFDETATDGEATERQDFLMQEYYKYIWLQLNRRPVISVQEIKLVLPNDQEVISFDMSWVQLNKEAGQVMIIPASGSIAVTTLGQSGAWLPLIYGWTDFIPDVFHVKYTAGFTNEVPAALKNLIGMMASIGPLAVLGDLIIGAGIAEQSLNMDGLHQAIRSTASATNSGFGARIRQYLSQIRQERRDLYRYYRGIPMQVA